MIEAKAAKLAADIYWEKHDSEIPASMIDSVQRAIQSSSDGGGYNVVVKFNDEQITTNGLCNNNVTRLCSVLRTFGFEAIPHVSAIFISWY